jgi:hypothetical protein
VSGATPDRSKLLRVTTHKARPGQVRLARDCWVSEACADDLRARCAAVLDSTTDGVISSITAAQIHRTWLPELPPTIHVATATPERRGRAMTRTKRAEFVAHRLQLSADDVMEVDSLAVMTPARAWRDLAGVLDLAGLVAAGDSVLRMGVSLAELQDVLGRTARGRYARLAKAALPLLDARSRSRPESHLRVAVSGDGMPRFEVNEPVFRDEGGWLAEPDLSLADAKLALEYLGAEHAEVKRRRKDITRERDMRRDRWLVLEYGPAEVFGRPWQIAPEVRIEIAERAPHLLQPHRAPRARRRSPRVGY